MNWDLPPALPWITSILPPKCPFCSPQVSWGHQGGPFAHISYQIIFVTFSMWGFFIKTPCSPIQTDFEVFKKIIISQGLTEILPTPFAALSARAPTSSGSVFVPCLPVTSREKGTVIAINYCHRLWVHSWVPFLLYSLNIDRHQPAGTLSIPCFAVTDPSTTLPSPALLQISTTEQFIHRQLLLTHISHKVSRATQVLILHPHKCGQSSRYAGTPNFKCTNRSTNRFKYSSHNN